MWRGCSSEFFYYGKGMGIGLNVNCFIFQRVCKIQQPLRLLHLVEILNSDSLIFRFYIMIVIGPMYNVVAFDNVQIEIKIVQL